MYIYVYIYKENAGKTKLVQVVVDGRPVKDTFFIFIFICVYIHGTSRQN